MAGNVHQVFSLTPPIGDHLTEGMNVTCACGKTAYCSTVKAAIVWFGSHCYTAALDRAIEILKS